jgi:hypothetical protein
VNLRILKKLARKARPLVLAIAKKEKRTVAIFDGFDEETPVGSVGKFDRKHFERFATRQINNSVVGVCDSRGLLLLAKKADRKFPYIRLCSPWGALNGTPGHEWRCCYEVPEYDCEDLYSFLLSLVRDHYTDVDYSEHGMTVRHKPNMSNPARVFKLAKQMIAEVSP